MSVTPERGKVASDTACIYEPKNDSTPWFIAGSRKKKDGLFEHEKGTEGDTK